MPITQNLIRVLDAHLIDHIAAGEVVERPASVAKELVENALDSGANHIEIQLEEGGLRRIQVVDNGIGMGAADARRCLLRHATSKILKLEHLSTISTLGFRGEALSSIAAVSRLTLTTRQAHKNSATRLLVHAGHIVEEMSVGAPVGTSVEVADLFYNTPARRKFMRSEATEQAHVVDWVMRLALGARRGGMILSHAKRRLLDVTDDVTGSDRVRLLLNKRAGELYRGQSSHTHVRVESFVSAPALDRGATLGLWFFVNGRFVRERLLARALLDVYQDTFAQRFPTAVVYIDVPSENVDVNVHPQKLEVRFDDPQAVYAAIGQAAVPKELKDRAATQAMSRHSNVMKAAQRYFISAPAESTPLRLRHRTSTAAMLRGEASGPQSIPCDKDVAPKAPSQSSKARPSVVSPSACMESWPSILSGLVPKDNSPKGFVLCQNAQSWLVVDWVQAQIALCRLVFKNLQEDRAIPAQSLLLPPTWRIEDEALALAVDDYVLESVDNKCSWGLGLTPVEPACVVITQVPQALAALDAQTVARRFIEALVEHRAKTYGVVKQDRAQIIDALIRKLIDTHAFAQAFAKQAVDVQEARSLFVSLVAAHRALTQPYDEDGKHVGQWLRPLDAQALRDMFGSNPSV